MPVGRIRAPGAGRKLVFHHYPSLDQAFLSIVDAYIAGDPCNEKIRWVRLTNAQIKKTLKKAGYCVGKNMVRNLLKKHGFVKRKMQRKKACGRYEKRDEQFNNISHRIDRCKNAGNRVISMDTKKKEYLGELYREGKVYATQAIEVYDHDYSHLATDKVIPHGIYDLHRNKAHINLGKDHQTADFIAYSLAKWWEAVGKKDYPCADELLLLCDAGGANSHRHHIFKIAMQHFVDKVGVSVRVTHYPPYTSKWNPIEHRLFPHISRALSGIPLTCIKQMKKIISSVTSSTGLITSARIISKVFNIGKRATKEMVEKLNIEFDKILPELNYVIRPTVF